MTARWNQAARRTRPSRTGETNSTTAVHQEKARECRSQVVPDEQDRADDQRNRHQATGTRHWPTWTRADTARWKRPPGRSVLMRSGRTSGARTMFRSVRSRNGTLSSTMRLASPARTNRRRWEAPPSPRPFANAPWRTTPARAEVQFPRRGPKGLRRTAPRGLSRVARLAHRQRQLPAGRARRAGRTEDPRAPSWWRAGPPAPAERSQR